MAPLYSVTVQGPHRDVANNTLKEHATMGKVCMYHANYWLVDPGFLRFLVVGKCFGDNQTPSSLCLAGVARNNEIKIGCFLPQGGLYRAPRQRLPGPLPPGTKQPQRPPPTPEPPPGRVSSSSNHDHSYCSSYASGVDIDSRDDPVEGEPPSESTGEETIPLPLRLSCPFSSGSITALWSWRQGTSVRWH